MSDLATTTNIQRAVGDPLRHAWVSANAGTGKTYVLVRRVIRQLLAGSRPGGIVCITFTKAAAAEMANRLLKMLSEWALMEDERLRAAIAEVTGVRPPPEELADARRLFARALESPGGLKIQTIHGFCGSILARFPAEAELPLGFRPLEDDQAFALLRAAAEDTAEYAAANGGELAESIAAVTERFEGGMEEQGGFQTTLEDVLILFAQKTRGLSTIPLEDGGALTDILRDVLNCQDENEAAICRSFASSLDRGFLSELHAICAQGGARARSFAAKLKPVLDDAESLDVLEGGFAFDSKGGPANLSHHCKATEKIPDRDGRWADLYQKASEHLDRLRRLRIFQANEHFIRVAWITHHLYTLRKQDIGGLDYDDLIEKTNALLSRVDNAWVRFKLDEGIEHVLLDEAQDTSFPQWELFRRLVEEITSTGGDAAGVDRPRSLFVVGDPKQSIYAFNGAEADQFEEVRRSYEQQLGDYLVSERLFLSFRTSQPVLDFVDRVFDRPEFAAFAGGYHRHKSHEPGRPGSVEIWPAFPEPEGKDRVLWDRAIDEAADDSVDRQAALAIARDIQRLSEADVRLSCKSGRPIRAGDVMVLFQRRGARFKEVLRALGELGVPCAGTDRIAVARDAAVRDLIALLRFAANTDDSLSLAVLLKSPFFGWSEEDLYDLAAERKEHILWRELQNRAKQTDGLSLRCQEVEKQLRATLDEGARKGPYALLSYMLDAGVQATGRSRLEARLGSAYREPVEAFLEEALTFEDQEPRSVHGFLKRAERLTREIKREVAGEEATGVRVMTVHGAKGLEAPVVYLADTDFLKKPADQRRREPFVYAEHDHVDGALPILVPGSSKAFCPEVTELALAADERRYEEYQRLLYVAATRAEEHLIVCGGKENDTEPKNWYRLCQDGMGLLDSGGDKTEREAAWGGRIIRFETTADISASESAERDERSIEPPPAWLNTEAPLEEADPVIYPSALGSADDEGVKAIPAGTRAADPRRRGLMVHRLLEVLPQQPRRDWDDIIARHFARMPVPEQERQEIAESVVGLLDDKEFSRIFGSDGRAEVSVQGQIGGVTVSGQIDRLLVEPNRVTIVEYKSTRWVPVSSEALPTSHVRQVDAYRRLMGQLYPEREIRALLLYTAAPRAFEVG